MEYKNLLIRKEVLKKN